MKGHYMSNLLLINASPRQENSRSRQLAESFIDKWSKENADATVVTRDVSPGNVNGPTQDWVEANFVPKDKRTDAQNELLAESDEYISEIKAASHVVISTPLYNFSAPWNLKAYIDNLVREGETFYYSVETSHGPLLEEGKKLLLIFTASGDYAPDAEFGQYDVLTPTIATAYGFMGLTDLSVIHCGNRAEAPELKEASMTAALSRIDELSAVW
ncbi:MAG: NAD(P)H-dependent oxidoreductase [Pseudoruegeria sp.]